MKNFYLIVAIIFWTDISSQSAPWQQTSGSFSTGVYDMAAINNTIFAATNSGIYSSSDNGISWTNVLALDAWTIVSNGNNLYAGSSSNQSGAIWTSTNAGVTWTNITPSGFPIGNPYYVQSLLVNGPYLYAGFSGGASPRKCPLASLSSSNWTVFTTGFSGVPAVLDLAFNGTEILASTDINGVWQSTPVTPSWTNSTGMVNTAFPRALAINNSTAIVGTSGSPQIHRSINGGTTWSPISSNSFSSTCGVWELLIQNNGIYAGTDQDGVVHSNDGGISWTGYNSGFKDGNGNWYCNNMRVFSLLALNDTLFAGTTCGVWKSIGCSQPSNVTPSINLNICSGNTTTLQASGLGIIDWYSSLTSTLSMGSGSSFTTPNLIGTTTFYFQNDFCSTRTPITVTVNVCANVKNMENDDNTTFCFPNPTEGKVTFSGMEINSIIKIYNLTGGIICKQIVNAKEITFDLNEYAEGIYIYSIISHGKQIKHGKLIRRK